MASYVELYYIVVLVVNHLIGSCKGIYMKLIGFKLPSRQYNFNLSF